jgi:hypothetical protein
MLAEVIDAVIGIGTHRDSHGFGACGKDEQMRTGPDRQLLAPPPGMHRIAASSWPSHAVLTARRRSPGLGCCDGGRRTGSAGQYVIL